jgi:hypothetical protein
VTPVASVPTPAVVSVDPDSDTASDTVNENDTSVLDGLSVGTSTTQPISVTQADLDDEDYQENDLDDNKSYDSGQTASSSVKGLSSLFSNPLSSLLTISLLVSLSVSAVGLALWIKEKNRGIKD